MVVSGWLAGEGVCNCYPACDSLQLRDKPDYWSVVALKTSTFMLPESTSIYTGVMENLDGVGRPRPTPRVFGPSRRAARDERDERRDERDAATSATPRALRGRRGGVAAPPRVPRGRSEGADELAREQSRSTRVAAATCRVLQISVTRSSTPVPNGVRRRRSPPGSSTEERSRRAETQVDCNSHNCFRYLPDLPGPLAIGYDNQKQFITTGDQLGPLFNIGPFGSFKSCDQQCQNQTLKNNWATGPLCVQRVSGEASWPLELFN